MLPGLAIGCLQPPPGRSFKALPPGLSQACTRTKRVHHMVVLQAMFKQAIRWRWIEANPVKAVEKPSGTRERAVVCLAPTQVEAIRAG